MCMAIADCKQLRPWLPTSGAPPHGGIAFGFDRLCAVLNGSSSIRDFIAFPKNNQGRDMMIDAPSPISAEQLEELSIGMILPEKA